MKNLFPVSVAGALALGAVGAHASIAAPSSGSSDAVLFAEVVNTAGTAVVASYAGDTGLSVTQMLSLSGSKTVLGSDANLAKLFAADGSGDTIVWGVIGGQYPTSGSTVAVGNTQLISTTSTNTAPAKFADSKLSGMVSAYGAGITSLNSNLLTASSIEGTNPATSGVWDVVTQTAGLAFWGGALGNEEALGTTANLYYITGGGGPLSYMGFTLEGTASLSAAGLTLANGGSGPPPPVPLPAAVWLLGSGLLGLAGVARRKAKA